MAPTPPLFWQRVTLSANEMLPRWMRHILPATPGSSASPVPKSYSGALAPVAGVPSIGIDAYGVAPTVSVDSRPVPIGTVDSTCTPGAEISTSAFDCEND